MKHRKLLMILSLITSALTFENSFASILFSDDFQGNLSLWNNTNSTGIIVTDPLDSDGHALAFTRFSNVFISSKKTFTSTTSGNFILSYDYLGLTEAQKTGGGYVGIKNRSGTTWLSGDSFTPGSNSKKTPLFSNPDDGQWNHVSFTFTSLSAVQLKLEQWEGKSDVSKTALFKNLVLTDSNGESPAVAAVPITRTVWLMMTGLIGVLGLNRRKASITA